MWSPTSSFAIQPEEAIKVRPLWRIRVDNTLECVGRKKICVGPIALIKVLSTWVGSVPLMVSKKLSDLKKIEFSGRWKVVQLRLWRLLMLH